MNTKKTNIKKNNKFPEFRLIPNTAGIILNGIWVKKDNSELKIVSAFGGTWSFRPLKEEEKSL